MSKTERNIGVSEAKVNKSVFSNPPEGSPLPVISLLRLAEREGAYGLLSEKIRQRLEMHFLQGMSLEAIAGIQDVTKQAISQTIRRTPESLYKKMTRDSIMHRTNNIGFREILEAYSAYTVYLDQGK